MFQFHEIRKGSIANNEMLQYLVESINRLAAAMEKQNLLAEKVVGSLDDNNIEEEN